MRFPPTLLIFASLVVPAFSATVADVQADITTISSQLTALDNSFTAFANPGGTWSQGLAIHANAVYLSNSINKGTVHAKTLPKPISEADGRAIFNSVVSLEHMIKHALDETIVKKAAFQTLSVGEIPALATLAKAAFHFQILSVGGGPALVKHDLKSLEVSTTALVNALIAVTPASVLSDATALKSRVDAAFAKANAAYST